MVGGLIASNRHLTAAGGPRLSQLQKVSAAVDLWCHNLSLHSPHEYVLFTGLCGRQRALLAFVGYCDVALNIVDTKRQQFCSISPSHKALLPTYETHFQGMEACVLQNSVFLHKVHISARGQM